MGAITRKAFADKLEADATLKSLLDPYAKKVVNAKGIYGSWRNELDVKPDNLPLLIVKEMSSMPSKIDGLEKVMWMERWSFQAWAATRRSIHIEIIEYIDFLFNEKFLCLPSPYSFKRLYKVGGSSDNIDPSTQEVFSIAIYELIYTKL